MERPDPILAVGAIVAEFLYDIRMPLVVCDIAGIVSGNRIAITIEADGRAIVRVQTENMPLKSPECSP
jgi:predicted aconitase with swiveling domain